jgi:hypothetical protein
MPGIATVRVHVNSRNIFQRTVGEKGGFMRKGTGGRVEGSRELEAGNASVEVWVTAPNKAGERFPISGNFPGGQTRNLNIHLSAKGEASVNLN